MPFKSEKQRKWMHANNPDMAQEWEGKASGGLLRRAIANTIRLPDLARLRSGGLVKTGSKLPGSCMDATTRALNKFKES